ncbi:MAG: nucleotidyltransferase family protein [Paludibacteraceae bacterium]|nr:nucleotidyltransferase family protein [Paludibacteraceae bacterium]
MKAMIFCAGLGTRLKPLTDTMPKALVPLAGKPLLQWQVEKLRDAGITDIIVNVHHFPDMIIDTIRANNGWGCNILISDERDQLLDTGGGLRKALPSLLGKDGSRQPVLACNVDILSNIDIREFIHEYNRQSSNRPYSGLLVVSERKTQRYLCFDEKEVLRGWTNIATGEVKPSSLSEAAHSIIPSFRRLAFSGLQILSPEALELLAQMPQDKFSLIDFYLHLCEENQKSKIKNQKSILRAYVPENYRMMDVGKIDQIAEAEAFAENL